MKSAICAITLLFLVIFILLMGISIIGILVLVILEDPISTALTDLAQGVVG